MGKAHFIKFLTLANTLSKYGLKKVGPLTPRGGEGFFETIFERVFGV